MYSFKKTVKALYTVTADLPVLLFVHGTDLYPPTSSMMCIAEFEVMMVMNEFKVINDIIGDIISGQSPCGCTWLLCV